VILSEQRKSIHKFLLNRRRGDDDIFDHAVELQDALSGFSCSITLWEHPILFESGLDVFIGKINVRLTLTKKGYRLYGYELDSIHKSLTEIICIFTKQQC